MGKSLLNLLKGILKYKMLIWGGNDFVKFLIPHSSQHTLLGKSFYHDNIVLYFQNFNY